MALKTARCRRTSLETFSEGKKHNFLGKDPASTKVKHRPVDPVAHAELSASIGNLRPEER